MFLLPLYLEGQMLTTRDNFRPDYPGGHTRGIHVTDLTNFPSSTISLSSHRLWLGKPQTAFLFPIISPWVYCFCWICHKSQSSEPLLLVTHFAWVSPIYMKGKRVNKLLLPFLWLIFYYTDLQEELKRVEWILFFLRVSPHDTSMLCHMSGFHFFLRLSNIPLCT